jgi:hypothetical protein
MPSRVGPDRDVVVVTAKSYYYLYSSMRDHCAAEPTVDFRPSLTDHIMNDRVDLIDMDPSAAKGVNIIPAAAAGTRRGRSVFCQAIATVCCYWNLGQVFGREEGPIQALFVRQCPDAVILVREDRETGLLHPFTLAAAYYTSFKC